MGAPSTVDLELAIDAMLARVRNVANSGLDGFPHHGDTRTGRWTTTPNGFWTGGFWVGELWLAAAYSSDHWFGAKAEEWLAKLDGRVHSDTVFRGFLFYYSAVTGAELFGSDRARELAIDCAQSLAATFDETARILPLGSTAEEAHTVGASEANVDGLTASPLLLWASRETGDDELARVAIEHAYRTADYCVLADASVIQSASFDPNNGNLIRRYTHKGYADDSVWTRAQAWAMLGYTLCAGFRSDEKRLLDLAERTTDWWLDHVPSDGVAYWDFSAPVTPQTMRDTSGTAIAAAAMLKLARLVDDEQKRKRYENAARLSVDALVSDYLTPAGSTDGVPAGILTKGCFDPKSGTAIDSELIWGDYFLLESLGVLTGRLKTLI
ncbi:glycoside hydrolase family 88 protein [Aureimonas jatrophae]|uniref:Unsaturated chondroitin disaccharide hydrolase n=1 Tax=Aureimonas jatrophae TaxID=1166073 RepID=A0A1H0EH16_9HYPH|nr:glycoside hydrolase family 88 protein [Aureimonas jatrophae]MBB3952841.1 unsaturated chondroitin disaccharide hydrolase [Aureimonas jatrophae]SDN81569.1 unsaturated chondroitin disaccharide hydrolase [Aureimonas jatrophae]